MHIDPKKKERKKERIKFADKMLQASRWKKSVGNLSRTGWTGYGTCRCVDLAIEKGFARELISHMSEHVHIASVCISPRA